MYPLSVSPLAKTRSHRRAFLTKFTQIGTTNTNNIVPISLVLVQSCRLDFPLAIDGCYLR